MFDEGQPTDDPVEDGYLAHHAGQHEGHETDQPSPGQTSPTASVSQEYFGVAPAPLKPNYEDGTCDMKYDGLALSNMYNHVPVKMRTFPMKSSPVLKSKRTPARRKQRPREPR